MPEDNGTTSVDISKGGLRISGKRTAEIITILLAVGVGVLAYAFHEHSKMTEKSESELTGVLKEMVAAQREQNCLISIKQDHREQKADWCKRLAGSR